MAVESSITHQGLLPFAKVDELPALCKELAQTLECQPLFDGKGLGIAKKKLITIESYDDARIMEIFSENAKKALSQDSAWEIKAFTSGETQISDSLGHRINRCLTLRVSAKQSFCSIDALKTAYDTVLDQFTKGWKSANIEDHSDIVDKKEAAEFNLYVMEKSQVDNVGLLVRCLADRLSITDDVSCDDYYGAPDNEMKRGVPYLWIKTANHADVVAKLCLKLEEAI